MPGEDLAARCEDLTKTYRTAASTVHALRGITTAFPRSALTAVAGPSGSGKSSFLRLLVGMDRPTGGSLVVDKLPLHRAGSRARRGLRKRVGYVYQRASDNFFPHLTVDEHLRLAEARSTAQPRIEIAELEELLGIEPRLGHLPAELSGGEQARAALAQVLAGGASIIVADEPTAELDSGSATEVIGTIRTLVDRGVTIIVATHDRAVMSRSDDLVELEHGVLRTKARGKGATPRLVVPSSHLPVRE